MPPSRIEDCIHRTKEGVMIAVSVLPNSPETDFKTYDPWRKELVIHISEPAEENKANRALIRLLSQTLNVPESHLRIASGQTSRRKTIEVYSQTSEEVVRKIRARMNHDH